MTSCHALEARQGKARQGRAGQGRAGQGKARQGRSRQGQGRTRQGSTVQAPTRGREASNRGKQRGVRRRWTDRGEPIAKSRRRARRRSPAQTGYFSVRSSRSQQGPVLWSWNPDDVSWPYFCAGYGELAMAGHNPFYRAPIALAPLQTAVLLFL